MNGKPLLKDKDKKKKKEHSIGWWKKKLWIDFTKYIKARDKHICCTCGAKCEGHNAQGGHYIAKNACGLEYYFGETNTHCQCNRCNLTLEGNRPAYRAFIIRKYGEETLKDIETNYHRPCKNWDFPKKIDEYKEKLRNLESA